MKLLVQRVKEASVKVNENIVGAINSGLLLFLGVEKGDTIKDVEYLVKKVLSLRVFENDLGRIDKSVVDVNGELLVVSQFTLCGELKKGNRPSFSTSASPEVAKELYVHFVKSLKESSDLKVANGVFGAYMEVGLINDGPFTLNVNSKC